MSGPLEGLRLLDHRHVAGAGIGLDLDAGQVLLPALDQLWLPDAEGRTYTSELRMVAVDTKPKKYR